MIEEIIKNNVTLSKNKKPIRNNNEFFEYKEAYRTTENIANSLVNELMQYEHKNLENKPKILIPKTNEINKNYFKILAKTLIKLEDKLDEFAEKNELDINIDSTEYIYNLQLYAKFIGNSKGDFLDAEKISRIERFSNNPTKYFLKKADNNQSEDALDKLHYKIIPKTIIYIANTIMDIINIPFKTYNFLTKNKIAKKIDKWTEKKLKPYQATPSGTMDEIFNNKYDKEK